LSSKGIACVAVPWYGVPASAGRVRPLRAREIITRHRTSARATG
jgi:hypothetical protein